MLNFLNNSTNYGDITIIVQGKKRSPSPDSNSRILNSEVKRRKRLNYFAGNGKKKWMPVEQVLINDINITKAFEKIRRQAIKEAEENNNLDSLRVLFLSHVFPVNTADNGRSVTNYLKHDEIKALRAMSAAFRPEIPRAPQKAILYCKDIVDGIKIVNDEEDDDEDDDEDDGDDNEMLSTVKDLAKTIVTRLERISEMSFYECFVLPAIERILLKNNRNDIKYTLTDTSSGLMIGTKVENKVCYLFFVEIKETSTQDICQEEDEHTRLLKHMKHSIDIQLCQGVEKPLSTGLLVEGFRCTLFKMVLLGEGVYVPISIMQFSLVERICDLIYLPSVTEALSFVKLELDKSIKEMKKEKATENQKISEKRICHSFETKFCVQ